MLAAIAQTAAPDELLLPLTAMRRAIAQHMVQSVQASPHVATVFEVDMTAVIRHREAHKNDFAAQDIRLSFTPYFVAACATALRAHPVVNSRFTDAGIVMAHAIHIGVAVATEGGLLVPVIRNADEQSLAELARTLDDLASRARNGTLNPDELRGGHLHRHQSRYWRQPDRHADYQPAASSHPRRGCDRQAARSANAQLLPLAQRR